jgi:uncharacterized protein YkvS
MGVSEEFLVGDIVKSTREGWVAEVTAVLTNTVIGDVSIMEEFQQLGIEFEKQVLLKSELELIERAS